MAIAQDQSYSFDAGVSSTARSASVSWNLEVVRSLVSAVCRSGSFDLGENLGVHPTGVSVETLVRPPDDLLRFDSWLADLEPRVLSLLERRVYVDGPRPTLEEVGNEWGVTRERVRQVEARTVKALDRVFGKALADCASPLAEAAKFVLPLDTFRLVTTLVAGGVRRQALVAAALRQYSGQWLVDGGWVHHHSLAPRLAHARDAVARSVDEYGLLTDDAPSHLDGLFASEDDLLRYFRTAIGLVQLSGQWSFRDSIRARVVAALRFIGRPATKSEIAEAAGLDEAARVGSTLSALEGIVRADKDRWALAAWVDDPYDGIVGEINQRIDAHSGAVSVVALLEELPRKFGVSENSVMMYLQTTAYVIEEGLVRYAGSDEFVAASPSKWTDAFHVDGLWGQQIRVEQRYLEGYSLKVRFDIAYANGLRPGCDLVVPIANTPYEASVIWRVHDVSKGIDVGRVAHALPHLGFAPGDQVLVLATGAEVQLRQPPRFDEQPSDPADFNDPLLGLLGGSS